MTSLGCRLGTDKALVEERCFTEWQCSDNWAIMESELLTRNSLASGRRPGAQARSDWRGSCPWMAMGHWLGSEVAWIRCWADKYGLQTWQVSRNKVLIWQVREQTWQVNWMMNGKCVALQKQMIKIMAKGDWKRQWCQNHLQCGQP